jgi:hypothetical protein
MRGRMRGHHGGEGRHMAGGWGRLKTSQSARRRRRRHRGPPMAHLLITRPNLPGGTSEACTSLISSFSALMTLAGCFMSTRHLMVGGAAALAAATGDATGSFLPIAALVVVLGVDLSVHENRERVGAGSKGREVWTQFWRWGAAGGPLQGASLAARTARPINAATGGPQDPHGPLVRGPAKPNHPQLSL